MCLDLAKDSDGDGETTAFMVALSSSDSFKGVVEGKILSGVLIATFQMQKSQCSQVNFDGGMLGRGGQVGTEIAES